MWIDSHNHCLPGIDDGSKDLEMSLQMLHELRKQNVDRVVATPHFYLHRSSIDSFIERRAKAWESLSLHMDTNMPEVRLGAEVLLEHNLPEQPVNKLCIENSSLILLELPQTSFNIWMTDTIEQIAYDFSVTPIIAHIDRYFSWYTKQDYEAVLSLSNTIFQVNTEALINRKTMKFITQLYNEGYPIILGSDSHNLLTRAPNFNEVYKSVYKKWGKKSMIDEFIQTAQQIGL